MSLDSCEYALGVFLAYLIHKCFQGEVMNAIATWTFSPFLGAADRELLCSSFSEKANSDAASSNDDPPRVGNLQPIEANPLPPPCVILARGGFFNHRFCLQQHSEKFGGYVDAN